MRLRREYPAKYHKGDRVLVVGGPSKETHGQEGKVVMTFARGRLVIVEFGHLMESTYRARELRPAP